MARKSRKAVLPGQSRSAACSATCGRLQGHKGEHRGTLMAPKAAKVAGPTLHIIDGWVVNERGEALGRLSTRKARNAEGVEVPSADRYTVQPDEPKARRKVAAKARKAQARCRISRADARTGSSTRCSRAYGHKAKGLRHRFDGAVRVIGEAKSARRVAAPARTVKRERFVTSGKPSSRLA